MVLMFSYVVSHGDECPISKMGALLWMSPFHCHLNAAQPISASFSISDHLICLLPFVFQCSNGILRLVWLRGIYSMRGKSLIVFVPAAFRMISWCLLELIHLIGSGAWRTFNCMHLDIQDTALNGKIIRKYVFIVEHLIDIATRMPCLWNSAKCDEIRSLQTALSGHNPISSTRLCCALFFRKMPRTAQLWQCSQ